MATPKATQVKISEIWVDQNATITEVKGEQWLWQLGSQNVEV